MNIGTHEQIEADDDLRKICREIIAEEKTAVDWDQIASGVQYFLDIRKAQT